MALKKNDIFSALVDLWTKHERSYSQLTYFKGGAGMTDHIRTGETTIKAGSLILVPMVPVNNLACGSKSASTLFAGKYDGHTYFITQVAKPAIKGDEWEQQDAFVNPFLGSMRQQTKRLLTW